MRWGLVALAAGLVTPVVVLMVWVRTPYATGENRPLEQPVPFDHRHHVRDDGIDCRYCHDLVERSASAGIPSADRCMNCHAQVWNQSPLLEPVRASHFEDRPIAWQRVHDLPDFVFFDHSIHVANGIGCETCHGRVDRMARVYQTVPLSMGWCLDCHRNPKPHLRPPEEITTMGWEPRRPAGELADDLARLYEIREPTHCTTCHR